MSSVDVSGNLTRGVTIYDVLRNLVRGGWPNTETIQRIALLAIDAFEQGFSDSAAWQAELDRRAENMAPVEPASASETGDERAARLEAENTRLRAALEAQGGRKTAGPATATADKSLITPTEGGGL